MPWPTPVLRQFAKVPNNPSQADFYGPYNKLLYTLFPADTMFTVVPQFMPASNESAADFLQVVFEVLHEDKLVLILELNPPRDLRYVSRREAADNQIRSGIRDWSASTLADDCPFPVLYAVSAMGTKLCFFTKRPGQPVHPPAIAPDPKYEADTAPRERWNYDVLEEEGEERFRAMVREIMQACAAL